MNTALVNYHVKKPASQAFYFDVDGEVGNLISPELKPTRVNVRDMRNSSDELDFAKDGILFRNHHSKIEVFEDSFNWEKTYDKELQSLLAETIGAKEIIVFDHTVRVDDPDADRKPARNVHNDYSESGAHKRLTDILGENKARDFKAGHYGFVNIWRPVERMIQTSPIGFIRPSSMTADDWMTIELVYPDRIGQILGVAANKNHEWFYFSGMTPEEVLIFNIYDNQKRPSLGHSALDMLNHGPGHLPRKSIETRTLVRYD